ncbi:phage terminase small subunit P27 family [Nocardiopsis ganjiahuensis]|uniref:phage terminase small subunit P27 family n=1 Tax=Nocardiopsis ganjiahuensis TaxID=239984 RepID=UPI001268868F|nr:phage terminase small subunit P27 family [Nocardiopsis ganjiahuensis]
MPGPPRQPTELKRKRGNPGKESLPAKSDTASLAPADGIPPAPATLRPAGRAVWERLWTAGQAWLSPQTDLDVLTRLCEYHDERATLRAELDATGYMVPGSMGQSRINPLVGAIRVIESHMTNLEGLCGFNPSDRGRLGYAEVKRQSKLEELLAKRGNRGA